MTPAIATAGAWPLRPRAYAWTPIATNDGRFVDFAPYVPSINDDGVVAFQATLRDGHSGVFTGAGAAVADVAVTSSADCAVQCFTSHPDIDRPGTLSVYATLKRGGDAVVVLHRDGRVAISGERDGFAATGIGPLGPTMNDQGEVAVRGTSPDGRACIRLRHRTGYRTVAETGDRFHAFEGLPVVNDDGHVAFRADLPDGRQGVFVFRDDRCTAVATTGDDFAQLARFPTLNDLGVVAFAATRPSGVSGLYLAGPDGLSCVIDAASGFDSFRGILIDNAGPLAFYATPTGGQLGIYTGPDPHHHRLLGLGAPLFDATVTDFALNPVSSNEHGQLAVRVALDDGRQFILRADPVGRTDRST